MALCSCDNCGSGSRRLTKDMWSGGKAAASIVNKSANKGANRRAKKDANTGTFPGRQSGCFCVCKKSKRPLTPHPLPRFFNSALRIISKKDNQNASNNTKNCNDFFGSIKNPPQPTLRTFFQKTSTLATRDVPQMQVQKQKLFMLLKEAS